VNGIAAQSACMVVMRIICGSAGRRDALLPQSIAASAAPTNRDAAPTLGIRLRAAALGCCGSGGSRDALAPSASAGCPASVHPRAGATP
jgi:hypothetical protein